MADELNTGAKPDKSIKKIPVELLNDYWDAKGERICTNIQTKDEFGNPVVKRDAKGIAIGYVTETVVVELPVDEAKALLASGKARRADPLPE